MVWRSRIASGTSEVRVTGPTYASALSALVIGRWHRIGQLANVVRGNVKNVVAGVADSAAMEDLHVAITPLGAPRPTSPPWNWTVSWATSSIWMTFMPPCGTCRTGRIRHLRGAFWILMPRTFRGRTPATRHLGDARDAAVGWASGACPGASVGVEQVSAWIARFWTARRAKEAQYSLPLVVMLLMKVMLLIQVVTRRVATWDP